MMLVGLTRLISLTKILMFQEALEKTNFYFWMETEEMPFMATVQFPRQPIGIFFD